MRWTVALAVLALGCVPPSIDLRGRACPCGDGWVCVDDECVPEAEARRDGGLDAGADGGAVGMDAGPRDAGPPTDAGPVDAGGADAGADAGTDAGARDAGTPDAGAGETGCDGPLASAVVCDGYESDPGPWSGATERSGSLERSTTFSAVGAYSLHPETTAVNGQAAVRADGLGPFNDGDLWVRTNIYVPASASIFDFTFLYVGSVVMPYQGVSLGIGRDGRAGAYSTISSTYVSDFDRLIFPRDRWVCFELHVAVSETAGAVEVYMDGALAASRTALDTLPIGEFTYAATGIDYTDPTQGPLEIYLDEYALSRARLPCP